MRRSFLALALFAMNANVARADASATANLGADKSADSDSSSQEVREGQHFNAALRTGFMYTLVPGAGVEGNVLLNKSFQVGGSINGGTLHAKAESHGGNNEFDTSDDDEDEIKTNIDTANIRAASAEGHVRWFPFNSLYAVGGMSYRTVKSEMQLSDASNSSNYINVQTNSRAVCLDAGVGNEWSWDSGFFIGGEWFGVSLPVWAKSDTDTETGGIPSDDVQDDSDGAKRFVEQIGKGASFRLAMLHVGWAF